MSDTYQCPKCRFKKMKKLKLFQLWWCNFCKMEVDVNKIIKEWIRKGNNEKS